MPIVRQATIWEDDLWTFPILSQQQVSLNLYQLTRQDRVFTRLKSWVWWKLYPCKFVKFINPSCQRQHEVSSPQFGRCSPSLAFLQVSAAFFCKSRTSTEIQGSKSAQLLRALFPIIAPAFVFAFFFSFLTICSRLFCITATLPLQSSSLFKSRRRWNAMDGYWIVWSRRNETMIPVQ